MGRCSSISNNSNSNPTTNNSKPRSQNNVFHSHPSPTPQIRSFSTSSGRRSRSRRSSSRWDFFRLGLLRTPRMELHDLKTRTTTTAVTATASTAPQKTTLFLGVVSCKKSVDTIPSNYIINNKKSEKVISEELNDVEKMNQKEKEKEKETRLSHRRTFEWLKQLSHATVADQTIWDIFEPFFCHLFFTPIIIYCFLFFPHAFFLLTLIISTFPFSNSLFFFFLSLVWCWCFEYFFTWNTLCYIMCIYI